MQHTVYTTLPVATTTNVTFDNVHLHVPTFIPSPDKQVIFKESIKNRFTLSFDSWKTDRRVINTGSEHQLDIGSKVKVNSPKYLIATHQTVARSAFANKTINVSVFEHFVVRKNQVDVAGTT